MVSSQAVEVSHEFETVTVALDQALATIESDCATALDKMLTTLFNMQRTVPESTWRYIADTLCNNHPLHSILLQDPITHRSCTQPRGYAGDAVLLDMIYGTGDYSWKNMPRLDRTPSAIHRYTYSSCCGQAVRARRQILADLIDSAATRVRFPSILSIAAGHARELDLSQAFASGSIGRFVALDQDPESLRTIRENHSASCVECVDTTIRRFLAQKPEIGSFDLIYSTGLLDYLPDSAAQSLIVRSLQLLNSGGALLVANFKPMQRDCVYLDSFMRWRLIYRTAEDLLCLVRSAASGFNVVSCSFEDSVGYVGYLLIRKA